MALEGHGYIGRCRFGYKVNSTDCKNSKVTTRKMTEEEKIKYGVMNKEKNTKKDLND